MIIPPDKALHFIGGVVIYAAAHFASPIIGLMAVLVAAVGKEVYDHFHKDTHTDDIWDATATIAGGMLGWICSLSL
jgi:hypothetical protein